MKSGHVALIGKPNVGKSTLLNAFVGQKVSIVSNRPQTTRRRALGIAQGEGYQIAFVDTPGIHEPHTELGKTMVRQAQSALADVDLILIVVDSSKKPDDMDRRIANLVAPDVRGDTAVILVLNKMDVLHAEHVEERISVYTEMFAVPEEAYMLTTATKGHNLEKLLAMILEQMPEGEATFPSDEFTDQSTRFWVSELIREQVVSATKQELPHATAVRIDAWEETEKLLSIRATILVEKPSQRAIMIGKGGAFIKKIGTQARVQIEELLGQKVFLDLHVAHAAEWRMNRRVLRELEYSD
ncbi:MAG: GTPase Era [Fimbriimonadaceae bacterium]|nr:GTPase Era [Fimbriimonadaceae bacterium]